MKYFLSGLFLTLFLAGGALGVFVSNVKAKSIPAEATADCTWSELKLCYSGHSNRCCPGDKVGDN